MTDLTAWLSPVRTGGPFPLRSDIMNDSPSPPDADHTTLETALEQLIAAAQTQTDEPAGTYTVPGDSTSPAYTVEITAQPTADDTDTSAHRVSYCVECEWRVSTADYASQAVSSQAVEHAIETGHDIESAARPDLTETDPTDRSTAADASDHES